MGFGNAKWSFSVGRPASREALYSELGGYRLVGSFWAEAVLGYTRSSGVIYEYNRRQADSDFNE